MTTIVDPTNRDHPEKRLDFTVSRGRKILHIPVTPDLAADGGGRIGVSLAPNASITRRAARGIGEALSLTASEFSRLTGIVTNGARWHLLLFLPLQGRPFSCLWRRMVLRSLSAHRSQC